MSSSLEEAFGRARAAQQRAQELRADLERLRQSKFYPLHALFPRAARRPRRSRDRFDEAAWTRVQDLWSKRVAQHPLSDRPLVSVVIPAYNHVNVTVRCLTSIAATWFETLAVQIILVDDGSNDETARLDGALDGLTIVRNARNAGFIAACNNGAATARGRYLCFLNNDTVVREGWLDTLVSLMENDGSIGAAGSKLLYPDGRLQEAGGIIYADGSGENYGRGGDPADPRYNYVRDVDYCSGASLIVRRDLFERLGGFDACYAPAYYEDTHLCFAIREAGFRVVYQAASVVVHDEGTTAGTDLSAGTKRFQTRNRHRFVERWHDVLRLHLAQGSHAAAAAARRIRRGEVVLVVDSYVPMHDRESGSKRLSEIVAILRRSGYHVVFLPDNYAALAPYARELEQLGVEVLYHVDGGRTMDAAIDEILPILDFAWICRPELFAKYYPLLRRNGALRYIYDTVDLHFVRERREAALGLADPRAWERTRERELEAARRADVVVTVTEEERELLREAGIEHAAVIPNVHERCLDERPPFADRNGVLFIGGYNHRPNVDAVMWLCNEIMPLVWKELPELRVTLLGSNPPDAVSALASDRVRVTGYVSDVSPYFASHRVFAAPLRYGAGLKGKIGQSISYGVPVVTTQVGAEGFGFVDGRDYLHAESAADFARAIVRLHGDEGLWSRIAAAADATLEPFTPERVAERVRALLR